MVYTIGTSSCEGSTSIKIQLRLPEVEPGKAKSLPARCPNPKKPCPSTTFHRHERVGKSIRDTRVSVVKAERWQCTECGHTFRVYPVGVTRRQQSERLRALSVLLWTLGLSLAGVSATLSALGCAVGRTTVYNNICVAGKNARKKMRARLKGKIKVRVLGADCTHMKKSGEDKVVIQSIDVETGTTLEIDILPAEDERTIVRYIGRMAKLVGAEYLVSDDADAFKTAADAAGLKHQICQRHVVPNTLEILGEIGTDLVARQEAGSVKSAEGLSLEQSLLDVAELETMILARTPSSRPHLETLQGRYRVASPPLPGKKASSFYRLRLLTMDLAEDWSKLTLSDTCREPDGRRFVPTTNNASEQRIGLNIKNRYRTMRGYKSKWSMRQVPAMMAYLRESADPHVLSTLLAA
jgi:transposase-like protein